MSAAGRHLESTLAERLACATVEGTWRASGFGSTGWSIASRKPSRPHEQIPRKEKGPRLAAGPRYQAASRVVSCCISGCGIGLCVLDDGGIIHQLPPPVQSAPAAGCTS
jgi:hypothetical protein